MFWTIAKKDLKTVFRDRSALIFLFGMPIMFLLLFGTIFSGGSSRSAGGVKFSVLAVNSDAGKHGAEVLTALQDNGVRLISENGGEAAVRAKVGSGKHAAGVMIPPEFSAELDKAAQERLASFSGGDLPAKPAQAKLHILVDPAQTEAGGIMQGTVFGAVQRVFGRAIARAAGQPETAESSTAGNLSDKSQAPVALEVTPVRGEDTENAESKRMTSGNVIVPGYSVLFVFFLANSVAVSLITERQEGTLRRMMTAPIGRGQILFGKLLARGIVGVIQISILFLLGMMLLKLDIGPSPLGIALTALATIFAATGLGLLIASFGKTVEQIAGMTTLALFTMGGISGCMMPRFLMPEIMQQISLITPHAWALNAYNDLILRHLPVTSTLLNIGMVCMFGGIFYSLALARFKAD
jgi:ABC-2 type transport system permease protein